MDRYGVGVFNDIPLKTAASSLCQKYTSIICANMQTYRANFWNILRNQIYVDVQRNQNYTY